MAAPCVSCSVTLKCGDITAFKHALPPNENERTRKSLRNAISKIQADVNAYLTKQVEIEKQQAKSQVKNERIHSQQENAGGSDEDEFGLEDEDNGEDKDDGEDCPKTAKGAAKRDAEENCVLNANKKSKPSET